MLQPRVNPKRNFPDSTTFAGGVDMVTPPLAARLPFGFGQVRETPEPFGRETIDNPRSDLDALPQSGMQTLMDLGGMVSPLDPFAVKDLMSGKPEYPKAQGFQCSD